LKNEEEEKEEEEFYEVHPQFLSSERVSQLWNNFSLMSHLLLKIS